MNPRIGIIGLGKLGLCLALNLEQSGYSVLGYDVDEKRLKSIQNKSVKTIEPRVEELLARASELKTTNTLSDVLSYASIIFIVVPTPSNSDGSFNHDIIDSILSHLGSIEKSKERKTLVINSTTMPGYCASIEPEVDALNLDLVYNPEFIAQGSIIDDQLRPDQVLIGAKSQMASEQLKQVYKQMCLNTPAYHLMDLTSAEIAKLATNCFLTMKISFANHIGDLATKAGANPEKILSCVGADQRIGGSYLKYGYGFGGPCFPRDNKAMASFSDTLNHDLHLSKATDRINAEHLDYQLQLLLEENKAVYCFDDVSYKKGTDNIEESQQLALAVKLAENGKAVKIKASHFIKEKLEMLYPSLFQFELTS